MIDATEVIDDVATRVGRRNAGDHELWRWSGPDFRLARQESWTVRDGICRLERERHGVPTRKRCQPRGDGRHDHDRPERRLPAQAYGADDGAPPNLGLERNVH